MFGLMTKRKHDGIVDELHAQGARTAINLGIATVERDRLQRALDAANSQIVALGIFKAKVMKGLNAANAKRAAAKREAAER